MMFVIFSIYVFFMFVIFSIYVFIVFVILFIYKLIRFNILSIFSFMILSISKYKEPSTRSLHYETVPVKDFDGKQNLQELPFMLTQKTSYLVFTCSCNKFGLKGSTSHVQKTFKKRPMDVQWTFNGRSLDV